MNERFREFAEQAGLEYNFDPMTWLKYEKFAELIVRECAKLTRWKEYDMSVEQRIRLEIYQELKEHFGAK
jgi:hypothetical protein